MRHPNFSPLFFSLVCITLSSQLTSAEKRVYFIAAKDIDWDYAPSGRNLVNGKKLEDDEEAKVFTVNSEKRIGKVYRKTLYREYTDATFLKEKKHDHELGFLGPMVKGQVGDSIWIVFKNMATKNYSIHSHGVVYQKSSEGAPYLDSTYGEAKDDDIVPPGGLHVYKWSIPQSVAPTKSDSDCLTWLYHSHVNPVRDVYTGLIGPLIICKNGTLSSTGKRKDIIKERALLFSVTDENKSWFIDYNINKYLSNQSNVDKEDEEFIESNLMHSINGYVYGNLRFDHVCQGEKIAWYLMGFGNEVDIHTVNFNGNPLKSAYHVSDAQSLSPGRTTSGVMSVSQTGVWMISCQVADHLSAGMIAYYQAKSCGSKSSHYQQQNGGTRIYFIAAEDVEWDYGPTGLNLFDGGNLTAEGSSSKIFFEQSGSRIGGRYVKARYIEYENGEFRTRKERWGEEAHLGILGPVIRAEEGDEIKVVFRNMASFPFSIHPHGVAYDKSQEGAKYRDSTKKTAKRDDAILPGQTYIYHWIVKTAYTPKENEPPCLSYYYSSYVDPVKDLYSGLIGPLVICKKGTSIGRSAPVGFDREFFLYIGVIDENKSHFLDTNMNSYCTKPHCDSVDRENEDFQESNKMHQINGYLYGNIANINIRQNQSVLWHVIGAGTEIDLHGIHFDGNPISENGKHKDTINALPGTFATFTMKAQNAGKWPLVCKTNDHYAAGMKTFYTVQATQINSSVSSTIGRVREYFIGIVEKEWDYAPTGINVLKGYALDDKKRGSYAFVHNGDTLIGRKYKKALYREFTDNSFTIERERTEEEKHLGILGPKIIAEIGDTVRVVIKNMAKRPYSIYPHGLRHRFEDKKGIKPGKTKVTEWSVTKEAAPGLNDPNCITWAYYSNVDPIRDTNSGLVGPLITCRKGTLDSSDGRKDIEQSFSLYWTVIDENESWYLTENIHTYAKNPSAVDTEDPDFQESNKLHAINGFIFGNARHFSMTEGDRVAWYLIGLGNEVDMHSVHFHGQTFTQEKKTPHMQDVTTLYPGTFSTLLMTARTPGVWLFHCHVNDHIEAGMQASLTIKPRQKKKQEMQDP